MQPEMLSKPDNKTAATCNDEAGIRRRKQQKLVYRIFTCKFSVLSLQCSVDDA